MPADYSNAPLIEALCEFHFAPNQNWDWTIPGLVYSKVKPDYPDKQEQQTIQFGVGVGQPFPSSPPGISRVQFLRKDRSALIQIGPHFLGVNHLRPYPGWDEFRKMILKNLDIYAEIAQPTNVLRAGLRYINKIEIPEPEEGRLDNLDDFLKARPGVPQGLQQNPIQQFIQRVEIPMEESQGVLLLQSGSLPQDRPGYNPVILDLDFVSQIVEPFSLDDARQWITSAHARIEHAFEACIGDKARELFGGNQHG